MHVAPPHILHSAPPESLHLVSCTADSGPAYSTSGPRPTARRPAPRCCTSPRPTSLHLTVLCPRAFSGAMWVAARGLWGHPAGLWTVLGGRKAGLLPGGVRGLHGSPVSCGKNLLKKFASKTKYGVPGAGRGEGAVKGEGGRDGGGSLTVGRGGNGVVPTRLGPPRGWRGSMRRGVKSTDGRRCPRGGQGAHYAGIRGRRGPWHPFSKGSLCSLNE